MASLEGFCLTPPPVPPRISLLKIERIRPHRAVRAVGCDPTAVELEPVRQHWEKAVSEPLIVTFQGTIIDGHKRLLVARERRIPTLPCVMLAISDDEALEQILARASAKNWWKLYRRIYLALTREEALRERARENQRTGGRKKVPSTLTGAKPIDVRKEIARMAGGGTGSVTKVKRILAEGIPLLKQEALRDAISLDAAWKISKLDHDEQRRELGRRASERRGRKRIQVLGRATGMRSERVRESRRERLAQIRRLLDELTCSAPLQKFRDPSLKLLARMEREFDVYDSDSAGDTAQVG
jgi:ParB-like chromosome segregation protein Spo0J